MQLFNQSDKAYLMLENGRIFEGRSCGARAPWSVRSYSPPA